MKNYAHPIHSVDALHAHFVEWVRFLDAKGSELEAQLAKLEARKAKAGLSETVSSSGPQDDPGGSSFLELAFGAQAIQTNPDTSMPATRLEPTTSMQKPSPVGTDAETREQDEPAQDPPQETGDAPDAVFLPSAPETPEPEPTEILTSPPEDEDLV